MRLICGVPIMLLLQGYPALSADYCDINRKTVLISVTLCSDRPIAGNSNCLKTRQRFAILGEKVLRYEDEFSPRGMIFHINREIEITNDPKLNRFVFGKKFPNSDRRAWATASYSGGFLRLMTRSILYSPPGRKIQETNHAYVFDLSDCGKCNLDTMYSSTDTGIPPNEDRVFAELREQVCTMSDGV
jgi:hypothetical protein